MYEWEYLNLKTPTLTHGTMAVILNWCASSSKPSHENGSSKKIGVYLLGMRPPRTLCIVQFGSTPGAFLWSAYLFQWQYSAIMIMMGMGNLCYDAEASDICTYCLQTPSIKNVTINPPVGSKSNEQRNSE